MNNIVTGQEHLSILHFNCRSIDKNFSKLSSVIDLISVKKCVIAVSETWTTKHNEDNFNLAGYKFVPKSRLYTSGGGVGLYVADEYSFKLRNDLLFKDYIVAESVFVELDSIKVIVGCVYRPPDTDLAPFIACMDTLLSKICKEGKKCYIAGDFNIDLLKFDVHAPTADYVNCLISYSFLPTISRPTRITPFSATLIDNIITNQQLFKYKSSIIYADVSDHLPIFLQTDLVVKSKKRPKFVFKRVITADSKQKFVDSLQKVDWSFLASGEDDPNLSYSSFLNEFVSIFDECFPIKKINITRKKNPRKPWMTKGLVQSCIKKEKLYKLFINKPTPENNNKYKEYRNKLNKLLKTVEKSYFSQKLDESMCNIKKTWQTIKTIINKNNNTPLSECFIYNHTIISDKTQIANKFNEYFVNIGPSLADKIPTCPITHRSYLAGNYKNSFTLFLTNPYEIMDLVKKYDNKEKCGL
jgi:hypothetical protein